MTDAAARLLADAFAVHGPACRLYARTLVPDAEDAQQEAFLRLARRLTAGEPMPEHLRAWLMKTVRSAALDARRRARRRHLREASAFAATPMFQRSEALDAESAERALLRLPLREREAVVLRIWGELGFEAIAQMTAVATSTAHADFNAGIEHLRRLMGAKDEP